MILKTFSIEPCKVKQIIEYEDYVKDDDGELRGPTGR
jgi:hypothetical protein